MTLKAASIFGQNVLYTAVLLDEKSFKLTNEIQKCWTRIHVDQDLADGKPCLLCVI